MFSEKVCKGGRKHGDDIQYGKYQTESRNDKGGTTVGFFELLAAR